MATGTGRSPLAPAAWAWRQWPLVAVLWFACSWSRPSRSWSSATSEALAAGALSALDWNLTNAALCYIGGSLKTALHGFTVLAVFLCGALVPGGDARSCACLLGGRCGSGSLLMAPALQGCSRSSRPVASSRRSAAAARAGRAPRAAASPVGPRPASNLRPAASTGGRRCRSWAR